MKRAPLAFVALALALAFPAAADTLEIAGTPAVQQRIDPYLDAIESTSGVQLSISAVGSGKGLLDLVEGKVAVAAIAGTLDEALASAKRQARAEGKSFVVPGVLKYHLVAKAYGDERPIAFVTIGGPVPELQKVLMYLRSNEGRMTLAGR
jgi:PBP superfamily domain